MNISLSSISKAAILGLAIVAVYKTSKKQAMASIYTVGSIGKDATNYVSKHYKSHYKNL
tara:strand:+ start:223 stop:399 length:177 start_codon:yes stop_codon:yes gene_type:complete